MSFEAKLEKYAEVIVKVGLNVQPGQRVLIWFAPHESAPLVRAITRIAYQVGARYVGTIFEDLENTKAWLEWGDEDSLEEYWLDTMEWVKKYGERGDALLLLSGNDPNFLEAYPKNKVQHYQAGYSKNLGVYRGLIGTGEISRCVAVAPTKAYADVVLSDLPEEERIEKMWDLIFQLSRVDGDDPVADWQMHVENLTRRKDFLNQKNYSALKYKAPGTDLTVGLPRGHYWKAGGGENKVGVFYVANIPTEEVFTMPDRTRVDGLVRATKPLAYGGSTVEEFSLRFERGKVVEVISDTDHGDIINNLIGTDENASYTGEVALVPHSSPISQSGRTFYNILYDENASNHIALGNAYRYSINGGTAMSDGEFLAAGGNISNLHVDFMIGSGEMDVDGITQDGASEPLMRAGEWVTEG